MRRLRMDLHEPQLAEFCRQNHIRQLLAFGSVLRDDFRSDSDVDLLVEFEPDTPVGFLTFSGLQRELAALLQRPVDLVPKQGLKPLIREEVLAGAEVVYAA